MPWGAAIAAVGVIGGAVISSNASSNASKAQQNSAAAANNEQQREYDTARADEAPYRAAGANALNNLNGLMKDPNSITSDPGYQFGMSQGTEAIDRSAAGGGSLYSGATLKALQRYGQDYAGTKLNDTYNRYSNIAGMGQVGTSATTAAGANAANQIGANLTGIGNAQGANALNQGNIYSNVANQLSSYSKNSSWGSGYTTGGSSASNSPDNIDAGGGWNPSDIRLKTGLRAVGTSPRGFTVYDWTWRADGSLGHGVVAQEVAERDPSAVRIGSNGFFEVDYSKV